MILMRKRRSEAGEWGNGVITLGYDSPAEFETRTAVA